MATKNVGGEYITEVTINGRIKFVTEKVTDKDKKPVSTIVGVGGREILQRNGLNS